MRKGKGSSSKPDSQRDRLGFIPPEDRFPALIFLVVESVLLGLAATGSPAVKIIAISGMIPLAAIGLVLFFQRSPRRGVTPDGERLNQLEKQAEKVAKTFEEELIERYGVRADSVSATVEILDLDGTCRITRSWKGFKVAPNVEIPHIPGKNVVSTPGAKITKPPTLINTGGFPKNVELVLIETTDTLCTFRISIFGSLVHNDPCLDYAHEIEISRAFLMTREETENHYKNDYLKNEYFYMETFLPIEKMEIDIRFPKEYEVRVFPGVFFGDFEFIHNSELDRVKSGFERTPEGARFKIDRPLVGFRYLIHWVSPSQKDVDKIKQQS